MDTAPTAPLPATAAPAATPPEKIIRHALRMADHLAAFPSDELRRRWLDGHLARWERLYDRWLHEPALVPDADEFEFAVTIALIAKLRARYAPVPA